MARAAAAGSEDLNSSSSSSSSSSKASTSAGKSSLQLYLQHSAVKFLRDTSLRGPRRIVASDLLVLRVFWLLVCCSFAVLLIVHLLQLVQNYSQGQTYMMRVQAERNESGIYPTQFPDLVLCPHQLFSQHAVQFWRNSSVVRPQKVIAEHWQQFSEMLSQMQQLNDSQLPLLLDSITYPISLSFYANSLSEDEVLKLGRDYDILVDCSVLSAGRRLSGYGCPISIHKIVYRKYLVCLQVSVDAAESVNTEEITLFLHAGNRSHTQSEEYLQYAHFSIENYDSVGQGFTMWLKEPNQVFETMTKSVILNTGVVNRVQFTETIEHKLQGPYPGICNNDGRYSQQVCQQETAVKTLQNSCKCNFNSEGHLWVPGWKHCSQLVANISQTLSNRLCVKSQLIEAYNHARSACGVACKHHTYSMEVSQTELNTHNLYSCLLQTKTFSNENLLVSSCLRNRSLCFVKATEILSGYNRSILLQDVTNITCNHSLFGQLPKSEMAGLVLKRMGAHPLVLQQQYLVTLTALYSQIGGASSLYLGLSLAFIAEIIDWVVRLCARGFGFVGVDGNGGAVKENWAKPVAVTAADWKLTEI